MCFSTKLEELVDETHGVEDEIHSVYRRLREVGSMLSARPIFLIFVGFFITLMPTFIRFIDSFSIISAVWPHAINTLDWTMWGRNHVQFMPLFFFFLVISGIFLRKAVLKQHQFSILFLDVSLGAILCFVVLYFLLDIFYLRGAFLLLPTVYASIMLTILLARHGAPRLHLPSSNNIDMYRVSHLIAVFLCSWLLLPGLPASFGLAPSPPQAPSFGYGSEPGPYDVQRFSIPYDLPQEVKDIQGVTELDIDFSIHLYLPLINSSEVEQIPLAIVLHGFLYPDEGAYEDWISHLAAKGMAVAYIQYPSDLWPENVDSFTPTEKRGVSDFLQHPYRYDSIVVALETLNIEALSAQRNQQIDLVIGATIISTDYLWIGGHSLGAAYSFFVLDFAMEHNWGQSALMVDFESPAPRPSQETLQPQWSSLPENTIVHSVVTQDDMSVGSCSGAFMQAYFAEHIGNTSVFIEVPSDKYGFPRMVASHYLQTNPAHDALADWAFYRRLDAQADWLTAEARNDTNTIDWARNYLLDPDVLAPMGTWSDGTEVLPLRLYFGNDSSVKSFQDC
jgi:hypothetical protein